MVAAVSPNACNLAQPAEPMMVTPPPLPPEARATRAGDLGEFFRAHHRVLRDICLRCARGDSAIADDLLGEAALRALEALASEPTIVDPFAWWATIIRNAARDGLRRRVVRREVAANQTETAIDVASGDMLLLARDELDATLRNIAFLPPMQRSAVALRATGSSYQEISQVLGVTIVNSRRLVHVARWRLRAGEHAGPSPPTADQSTAALRTRTTETARPPQRSSWPHRSTICDGSAAPAT